MIHIKKMIQLISIGGALNTIHLLARELLRRVYSSETHVGMVFDLTSNQDWNRSASPISVRPLKPSDVEILYGRRGLDLTAYDLRKILEHLLFLETQILTPYVGVDAGGSPMVICWLITETSNHQLRHYFGNGLPALGDDEILLEFIYTRPDCRGQQLMQHLTNALFRIGRRNGKQRAHAYINTANTSSLAGSRRIGWIPQITKQITWRWFKRQVAYHRFEG